MQAMFVRSCRLFLLIHFFLYSGFIYSQTKQPIDNETFKKWDQLSKTAHGISNNGKYIYCFIPSKKTGDRFLVYEIGHKAILDNFGVLFEPVMFTNDSRDILFVDSSGLNVLNLQNGKRITYLKSELLVGAKLIENSWGQFLIYKSEAGEGAFGLVVFDVKKKTKHTFSGIKSYVINEQRDNAVLISEYGLSWLDMSSLKAYKFTDYTAAVPDIRFHSAGNKIVFLNCVNLNNAGVNSPSGGASIHFYEKGWPRAKELVNEMSIGIEGMQTVKREVPVFSKDGDYIIFKLLNNRKPGLEEELKRKRMNLWHYETMLYLDENVFNGNIPEIALVSVSTKSTDLHKIQTLGKGRLELIGIPGRDYVLTQKSFINSDDVYWNENKKPEYKIINIKNGDSINMIPEDHKLISRRAVNFSPSGRFAYWVNNIDENIYAYEIETKILRNLTDKIKILPDIESQKQGSKLSKFWKSLWTVDDRILLVFDKYDIWQVDPQKQSAPINLTSGFGRANNIQLDLAVDDLKLDIKNKAGAEILLRMLDLKTKKNGFATAQLNNGKSLKLGSMDNCLYSWNMIDQPAKIKKALDKNVYLVTRQTASESPNLFFTSDLKKFTRITDIRPEKEYNWITSGLITYAMRDGRTGYGILYKPQNFDARKKYPIIFTYYQKRSDELNRFIHPGNNPANIDVPWFVSNGYLVFMPDIINNDPGNLSNTVLNSVQSAVDYLSKYTWFDTTRMGAQGQSFGGLETNILIANTTLFKAAQVTAGPSNLISMTLGKAFERSAVSFVEQGQPNMNASFWETPKAYLDNSPVLKADRIKTPLMLLQNHSDVAVVFEQGAEMFYALRRLKKPVWLFQYQNGGHGGLGSEEDALDFTIRQQQFFNHYLKGTPAPRWMIDGSLSLEFDTEGKCSKTCFVCNPELNFSLK